jgi:UDP-N-acetylmuramate--alanine ligase
VLDSVLRHHPRTQVAYLPHRIDVVEFLADRARSGDLVFTMGAGDVTALGPELLAALESAAESAACR